MNVQLARAARRAMLQQIETETGMHAYSSEIGEIDDHHFFQPDSVTFSVQAQVTNSLVTNSYRVTITQISREPKPVDQQAQGISPVTQGPRDESR